MFPDRHLGLAWNNFLATSPIKQILPPHPVAFSPGGGWSQGALPMARHVYAAHCLFVLCIAMLPVELLLQVLLTNMLAE